MKRLIFLVTLVLIVGGGGFAWWYYTRSPFQGYENDDNGIYRRMIAFGDCGGVLRDANHAGFELALSRPEENDTMFQYTALTGKIIASQPGDAPGEVNDQLLEYLLNMKCGDHVNYVMPYRYIEGTWLDDQSPYRRFSPDELVLLSVHLTGVFTRASFAEFMSGLTRSGDVDEVVAIQSVLMNEPLENVSVLGDICIEYLSRAENGDSVAVGKPVEITYTTHLLDGTTIDSPTNMQFEFGRPGQLVDGLQFGLSKLCKGDHVRIFVPSYLAFGEDGSSTGLIPPKTPLYFEVEVAATDSIAAP
ncbi:MAG: FKBP-type peptidyl-prolyl cis-trans isomerase [Flavobacteriales bacterium]|nr:FKBP-type peptidyl-prolyl cis-trans isomerase [Flavobacteriales bacterium]